MKRRFLFFFIIVFSSFSSFSQTSLYFSSYGGYIAEDIPGTVYAIENAPSWASVQVGYNYQFIEVNCTATTSPYGRTARVKVKYYDLMGYPYIGYYDILQYGTSSTQGTPYADCNDLEIYGPSPVWSNTGNVYFTAEIAGATYTWWFSGGTIDSGQGTNEVHVTFDRYIDGGQFDLYIQNGYQTCYKSFWVQPL